MDVMDVTRNRSEGVYSNADSRSLDDFLPSVNETRRKFGVQNHRDLQVYARAFALARRLFEITRAFPKEEIYSLTDQMRRSARAVCSAIAEGWRTRRYKKNFVLKLNLAESEAAETQAWLEFALDCGYISTEQFNELFAAYEKLLCTIVGIIAHADSWVIKT